MIIAKLLFGLGLFFMGMEIIKKSFYQAAGSRLKDIIATLTNNTLSGILTGLIVTVLIQSSSATTVIIISLVNAGILSFEGALGVIMGANIGTTVTVQLLSFSLEEHLNIIMAIGLIIYFIYYLKKDERLKYIARGIIGFSILFFGLELLSNIIYDFQKLDYFNIFLSDLATKPLLAVFLGVIITSIIQSSSALTGIVVILAKGGLIELSAAISLALGSNVGTCITAFIAAINSSKTAQKTAWAHILFNSLGVLLFLPFLSQFAGLVRLTSTQLARQLANAHTIFNLASTLLVLVVKDKFIRVVNKLT